MPARTFGGVGRSSQSPSLKLDFDQCDRAIDPRITFSRASTGWAFNSAGVLVPFAANAPRIYCDPVTLARKGLLAEEQRTNSIPNNTMVGAVASTPGTTPAGWGSSASFSGLSRQVVAIGTENGISSIDIRYSGTASSSANATISFTGGTTVAALSGQTWAGSAYARLVGGTLNGIAFTLDLSERDAIGTALVSSSTAFVPTASALREQRATHIRTLTNASTAFLISRIIMTPINGAVIDFTLRIGMPQLELGASPTSVIATTTAQVTRTADSAVMTDANFSSWYRQDEGTFVVAASAARPVTNANAILSADNGTVAERMQIRRGVSGSDWSYIVVDGGAIQASGGPLAATTQVKAALAYAANNFAACVNGGAVFADSAGTLPTPNQLQIGNGAGLLAANGHIESIAYYPRRISNSELQAVTSL